MNESLKKALASIGIVPKEKEKEPEMVFEIDGANGEKLIFPSANDITEIKENSPIEAEDGEHVFISDGKTYKIQVTAGVVTSMEVQEEPTEVAQEVREVLQAFADEFEVKNQEIAEMKKTIENLKEKISMVGHKKDDVSTVSDVLIGGKKIDLTRIKYK